MLPSRSSNDGSFIDLVSNLSNSLNTSTTSSSKGTNFVELDENDFKAHFSSEQQGVFPSGDQAVGSSQFASSQICLNPSSSHGIISERFDQIDQNVFMNQSELNKLPARGASSDEQFKLIDLKDDKDDQLSEENSFDQFDCLFQSERPHRSGIPRRPSDSQQNEPSDQPESTHRPFLASSRTLDYRPAGQSDSSESGSSNLTDENSNECDSFLKGTDSQTNFFNRIKKMSYKIKGEFDTDFVGKYDDFHTIDWQRDIAKDRKRHRTFVKKRNTNSILELISAIYDACSGWLCVFLIGCVAGCCAAIIDIGAGWMKDLKQGICPDAIYLNREQCCWSSNYTFFEGYQCEQWKTWPQLLGLTEGGVFASIISFYMYVFMAFAFALLAGLLVKTYAPYACGSGIPEVKTILSGYKISGYLGKWTLLIKSTSMVLVVAAGLSLGKEGPLVHICCCIGNVISYLFPKYGRNEAKKREILSASAGAGVSVAFGAPIGGVLFSLEEVSYYFPLKTMWRSFFCALIAAFVLRSINPFGTEHAVMFYVDYDRNWILIELIPFIFLGVFGGVIGSIFIKANIKWCNRRKTTKLGKYPITEIMAIVLITAIIGYPNEFTRMNSSELIRLLFSQCGIADNSILCDYKTNYTNVINAKTFTIAEAGPGVYKSIYLLVFAFIFKFIVTVFTFGIKVPAGIFIPSLTMGAIAGRIVGILMEQIAFKYPNSWVFQGSCSTGVNCMTPGIYAMVGAAACLSGITRMTVSLVVIVFELTGSVNFIVPLMCAVMTAKWIGDALGKQGLYDAHILLNGYPFLDSKEEFTYTTSAKDCMHPRSKQAGTLTYLTQNSMTLNEVSKIIETTDFNGFPIVLSREQHYLVGFVVRKDLEIALAASRRNAELYPHTKVVFSSESDEPESSEEESSILLLQRIVDLAPITLADETPMETVIDLFRKLGLRQVLCTHNGLLQGIITKKDVLRHIKQLKDENPQSILFG